MAEQDKDPNAGRGLGPRFQVRVPGFVGDEVIGLGEVITYATSTVGMRSCGGCARRAEALNRLVAFRRRQRSSVPRPR